MPAESWPPITETIASVCSECGSELAPKLLACPACHRLVHADRLKTLAITARDAQDAGDLAAALAAWNEALALLPANTRQHTSIADRIGELGRAIEGSPAVIERSAGPGPHLTDAENTSWSPGAIGGIAATVAVTIWKAKFLAVLLLTKAKFLLLGLTKASTFLSMFVSFGVYCTQFGPWFAAGLLLSIYIHEMGHVAMLHRYGVRASAPFFLPGFGAFVRYKKTFNDARQEARVALAGPAWGLGAALGCAAMYGVTRQPIWVALTYWGAIINLMNLSPIWQLDGARAFMALTRRDRWIAISVIAAAWILTADIMPLVVLGFATFRTVTTPASKQPDPAALWQYNALVVALSALVVFPQLVGLEVKF
jgi:Zn-dependent protease